MNIRKILTGMLFMSISSAAVFSQEPAKTDAPATEKKDDSSLEINAMAQFRMQSGQANSGYATPLPPGKTYTNETTQNDFQAADFNFRRIRLITKYQAAKWVGAVLDIKGENLIKPSTTAGGIQEATAWFKPGFLGTLIRVGQFKIPFTRELSSSSSVQLFSEASYVSKLVQENDIGLYLLVQPLELLGKDWAKKLDILFSMTNGDGGTDAGIGSRTGEFHSTAAPLAKLYNWRVQINPFGGPVKDGKEENWKDGEEIFSDSILWSIAAAGIYSAGWESQSGKPDGTNAVFIKGMPLHAHTFDTTLSVYGIYVNGEYTFTSGNNVLAYQTYQGTLGYNLKLGTVYLMPLVRYNYQQYDANVNGTLDDTEKQTSLWLGANLFAMKHSLKFQVFYNILNDAVSMKDATKPLGKNILYFQVQTAFGKKV